MENRYKIVQNCWSAWNERGNIFIIFFEYTINTRHSLSFRLSSDSLKNDKCFSLFLYEPVEYIQHSYLNETNWKFIYLKRVRSRHLSNETKRSNVRISQNHFHICHENYVWPLQLNLNTQQIPMKKQIRANFVLLNCMIEWTIQSKYIFLRHIGGI